LVGQAVQSVLNQTYREFEIVLVDDGSREDVIGQVDISCPKIRCFKQNNMGPAAARNFGVEVSEGQYIAFLDSDDVFAPDKLRIQLSLMRSRPDLLLSHTSYQYMDLDGRLLETTRSGRFTGWVYPHIMFNCPIATPTVMVRKEVFSGDCRFDESMRLGEDVLMWSRIAKMSEIGGIDEVLSLVRKHPGAAAFSRDAQLTATSKVAGYFLREEKGAVAKMRLRASYYALRARILLDFGEVGEARISSIYAIASCPLDISGYVCLCQSMMSSPAVQVLQRRCTPILRGFVARKGSPVDRSSKAVSRR
jgi:glycosyltransferase involved in cell wall biosynthesis